MKGWRLAGLAGVLLLAGAEASAAQCKMGVVAEFPVVMDRNRPLIRGEMNGKPMLALVDTGAFRSLMLRGAAEPYGLRVRTLPELKIVGVGGVSQAQATTIKQLKLGDYEKQNVAMVMAGSNRPVGSSDFAMILGQDVLSSADIELDLANNKIRLLKASGCSASEPLAYWGGAFAQAPIEALDENRKVITTVRLNGKPVRALLDTGAWSSVVSTEAARAAGVDIEDPQVTAAGVSGGLGKGTLKNYLATFDTLAIGEQTVTKAKLRMADLHRHTRSTTTESRIKQADPNEFHLILGADFFRSHRVLISYSQRRVYFSHKGGRIFQTEGPPLGESEKVGEEPAS
jgi:predicted aspartyl protease